MASAVRSIAVIADGDRVRLTLTGKQRRAFDLCATDAEALGVGLVQEARIALDKELPTNLFVARPSCADSGKRSFPEFNDSDGTSRGRAGAAQATEDR